MSTIVSTIALREITRLRGRFKGAASPLAVVFLLAAIALTVFTLRDAVTPGNGLYRIAVIGETPQIKDSRFAVVHVDEEQGKKLLAEKAVDVVIDGPNVINRSDDKSLYAVQTLKLYLKKQELERVSKSYDNNQAFPVRVGIYTLAQSAAATNNNQPGSATQAEAAVPSQPDEIIIPSLDSPPAPFTQVIVALIYVLPLTFISIFFTSSFMEERINRRLITLLSAPITPLQIILGKMLPYAIYAVISVIVIALLTHASVPLALLIYFPVILFIFAIYLLVPLFYRTFKDITFISMLVTTASTAILVFPAMFSGMSDLAYLSPLTLAVKMYWGESFGWREYLFPSLPMLLMFGLSLYSGTHLMNEEFLMGYRSITRKILDAIYLTLHKTRAYISIFLMSLLLVPVVYLIQVVVVVFASNLPSGIVLAVVLTCSAWVEEAVKTIGIFVLAERGDIRSVKTILALSFLSALGFLISEKLLMLVSISAVSQMPLAGIIFGGGGLIWVPLVAHFIFTSIVCLLSSKTRLPYRYALLLGAVIHTLYNWLLLGH
jgi:ABC-type Na+ efflux pump permease subunit